MPSYYAPFYLSQRNSDGVVVPLPEETLTVREVDGADIDTVESSLEGFIEAIELSVDAGTLIEFYHPIFTGTFRQTTAANPEDAYSPVVNFIVEDEATDANTAESAELWLEDLSDATIPRRYIADIEAGSGLTFPYQSTNPRNLRLYLISKDENGQLSDADFTTAESADVAVPGITLTDALPETLNLAQIIADEGGFEEAIDALGSVDYGEDFYSLVVSEEIAADETKTIPAKFHVVFTNSGSFNVSATKTLTIGSMEAVGARKIFKGAGNVLFAKGATGGVFTTAWWTGNDSSGTITTPLANLFSSAETNQGGLVFVPTGDWTKAGDLRIPSSVWLKGTSSNYYGYSAGVPNTGGTTIRSTTSGAKVFYFGNESSADNQRSIIIEGLNIEMSGAALTTATGLRGLGDGADAQNIYGLTLRDVCIIGGDYCVKFDFVADAQLEMVHFTNVALIGGATRCFYANTTNSSYHLDQLYASAPPGGVAVQFVRCGAVNITNRLIAGANGEGNQAHCAIMFGKEDDTEVSDVGDVVISGGYDEGCDHSWISYCYQDKHRITVNGGVQQGEILHYGVHHAILNGGTYWRRAFKDDVHPYVEFEGNPAPANSRFINNGACFRPFTYATALAASNAGELPVADGPAGQTNAFTQYSQFVYEADFDQDALTVRKELKVISTQTADHIVSVNPHEWGMLKIASTQANRAAMQAGEITKHPTTGVETIGACYFHGRNTDSSVGRQGFWRIFSSQTGSGNASFRGVQTNGTFLGNSLEIEASDGLAGNGTIGGGLTVTGVTTTTGGLQSPDYISAGTFASTGKLNAFSTSGAQIAFGYSPSLSIFATITQDEDGIVTMASTAASGTPKWNFANPLYVSGEIDSTSYIDAAAGFKVNGAALDKTHVGLTNVDNTSDATKNAAAVTLTNKTISGASNTITNIAQSSVTSLTTDLAAKAPLASPTFTGTVVMPDVQISGYLSVGDFSSAAKHNVIATASPQTLEGYSTSVYYTRGVDANGIVTHDIVGTTPKHVFTDDVDTTAGYLRNGAKIDRTLFDYYTDASDGAGFIETDLYTGTIAANTLANNGEKLEFFYMGTFDSDPDPRIRAYFDGTSILDTGAGAISPAANQVWEMRGEIIRTANNTARAFVKFKTGAVEVVKYTTFSFGISTLSTTSKILKVTGYSEDGANVWARMGWVKFIAKV